MADVWMIQMPFCCMGIRIPHYLGRHSSKFLAATSRTETSEHIAAILISFCVTYCIFDDLQMTLKIVALPCLHSAVLGPRVGHTMDNRSLL